MTKNFSESDHVKHVKRITEVELWELMETGMENVKNNGVLDGVMDSALTEYSSHALTDYVNKENRNDSILVTRSSNGK